MEPFKLDLDPNKYKLRVTHFSQAVGAELNGVTVHIDQIINKYSSTEYHVRIEELRKITNKEEFGKSKIKFPAFIPHKLVDGGSSLDHTIEDTNFLLSDWDFLTNADAKAGFPIIAEVLKKHLIFQRYSISGTGIHSLLLIDDPSKRLEYIELINERFLEFGFKQDEKFRNSVQKAIIGSPEGQILNTNPAAFAGVFAASTTIVTVEKKTIQQRVSDASKTKEKKEGKNHFRETISYLAKKYVIVKDTLTGRIQVNGEEYSDEILSTLIMDALMNGYFANREFVSSWVTSRFVNRQNVFADFVKKYEHLKPSGNFEKLAKTLIVDSVPKFYPNFVHDCLRLWFAKMVAQLYKPLPNEIGIFLIGPQNIGKTEWFRRALPIELRSLFADIPFRIDKDFKVACTKYMIIHDDEAKGKKLEDAEAMKRIFSADYINVRKVYGMTDFNYKRIASFCGSGNDPQLLKDVQNRRYCCLLLTGIDRDLYNSIDKAALFMEAYNLFQSGFDLETPEDLIKAIQENGRQFEVYNSAEEILIDKYPAANPSIDDQRDVYWWPVSHLVEVINENRKSKVTEYSIGIALRKMNYISKYQQIGRSKLRVYAIKMSLGGDWGFRIDGETDQLPLPDPF